MQPQFERTAMLLGEDAIDVLATKTVAVFGLGGVGGNAADALARAGIGHLVLVDNDVVGVSNVNRQLVATSATLGETVCREAFKTFRELESGELALQDEFGKVLPLSIYVRLKR